MARNTEELVLMARDMLTDLPESVSIPRDMLYTLIKPAIALWQLQTNNDPARRQNFIVASNTQNIVANVCDLANAIDTYGFRMEFIKEGDIEITYAGQVNFTVKFINSLDRFKIRSRADKYFIKCYMSGTVLRFCAPDSAWSTAFAASFVLRSAVIPSDPASLNTGIMPEIAINIADLVRKQLRMNNKGVERPPK